MLAENLLFMNTLDDQSLGDLYKGIYWIKFQ